MRNKNKPLQKVTESFCFQSFEWRWATNVIANSTNPVGCFFALFGILLRLRVLELRGCSPDKKRAYFTTFFIVYVKTPYASDFFDIGKRTGDMRVAGQQFQGIVI